MRISPAVWMHGVLKTLKTGSEDQTNFAVWWSGWPVTLPLIATAASAFHSASLILSSVLIQYTIAF